MLTLHLEVPSAVQQQAAWEGICCQLMTEFLTIAGEYGQVRRVDDKQ